MKKKQPKIRPIVFLRAAEALFDEAESYACHGIKAVYGWGKKLHSEMPELEYFEAVTRPVKHSECTELHSEWQDDVVLRGSSQWFGGTDERESRIYALLLCGILAKEGQKFALRRGYKPYS